MPSPFEAIESTSSSFQALSPREQAVSRFVFRESARLFREQQMQGAFQPGEFDSMLLTIFRMHIDGTIGHIVEPALQEDPSLIPIVDKIMVGANS